MLMIANPLIASGRERVVHDLRYCTCAEVSRVDMREGVAVFGSAQEAQRAGLALAPCVRRSAA